ncbi:MULTISPECIES: metallophosphoesterase family protein [unclassified Schlesneria]|uniref:metallophosphoesterase family protein n=1 Tax=unclassified Schlesneria TaxID=2762017 RepID=UPI00359FEBCE
MMMSDRESATRVGRRAFFHHGVLCLAAASVLDPHSLFAEPNEKSLKVGLITDLHYADKPAAGTRHYRDTLKKLTDAATEFEQQTANFVVELGDFIDAADTVETELRYLNTIDREFSAISRDRHYVLGNHCVDTLTKNEFLEAVGQSKSYYSFDRGDFHFVVLDACFRSDGQPYGRKNSQWTDANIPPAEVEWLRADLKGTQKKTVVFAHQRLDVSNDHGVKNGPEVRQVLEQSGKVLAVFQGHSHQNDLREIGGIHYCTLVAMVEGAGTENNGYSVMDLDPDGTIRLKGFRQQKGYTWPRETVHGS